GNTPVDRVEIADIYNPLGYKGNHIIFPLKRKCYLTTYMLQEFIDENYNLKDTDVFAAWKAIGSIEAVAQDVATKLQQLDRGSTEWQTLIDQFADFGNETKGTDDEIIIPNGPAVHRGTARLPPAAGGLQAAPPGGGRSQGQGRGAPRRTREPPAGDPPGRLWP